VLSNSPSRMDSWCHPSTSLFSEHLCYQLPIDVCRPTISLLSPHFPARKYTASRIPNHSCGIVTQVHPHHAWRCGDPVKFSKSTQRNKAGDYGLSLQFWCNMRVDSPTSNFCFLFFLFCICSATPTELVLKPNMHENSFDQMWRKENVKRN
jgi:hypothetical protein